MLTSLTPRRLLHWSAVGVALLLIWAGSSLLYFLSEQEHTSVGPFAATVQPTLSGHVVLDGGALLPQFRVPTHRDPLGISVELQGVQEGSLSEAFTAVGVVAADSQGEKEALTDLVKTMALRALIFGFFCALLTYALTWAALRLLGADRREQLRLQFSNLSWPRRLLGLTLALALLLPLLVLLNGRGGGETGSVHWRPVAEVFPKLPAQAAWSEVQVADAPFTAEVQGLVDGAILTYRDSLTYYGDFVDQVNSLSGLRTPLEGESVAVVVTDRHDNISMDRVARALGDRLGANLLLDLGDDTSVGASWEKFSINSLVAAFSGYDALVGINGNHDAGSIIASTMEDRGMTLLTGEPMEVNGLRILGLPDPRSTPVGSAYPGGATAPTIETEDQLLTEKACTLAAAGTPVQLVLVHDPAAARQLAASGCAPLILSGHLHRQVGPTEATGANGNPVTTLTTGSTGGSIYAFALGAKLGRDAQITLLTYDESGVVGLQVVTFTVKGQVEVGPYHALPTPIVSGDTTSSTRSLTKN